MRVFIGATVSGHLADDQVFTLSLHGPRGGTRAVEGLTFEQMQELKHRIEVGIAQYESLTVKHKM